MGLVISLIAMGFIALQINLERFADVLLDADYRFLLPGAALALAGLFSRALRWRTLLVNRLPFQRTFNMMNIAYLVNGILPLRLGELARIYLASKANAAIPAMQVAGTIVVERLLDVLAVVIMAAVALTAALASAALQTAVGLGAGLAIGGFVALLVLAWRRDFSETLVRRLMAKAAFLRRWRIDRLASDFFDGLMPMLNRGSFAPIMLWTAVSWLLSAAANYVLMYAFFEQGDWGASVLSIAAVSFAIALPAIPANIGTYEAAILAGLAALGYEQTDAAIAYAVTVHAINILLNSAVGIFGLVQEGISLGQLRAGLRQMQHNSAS